MLNRYFSLLLFLSTLAVGFCGGHQFGGIQFGAAK